MTAPARAPAHAALENRLDVETPELVQLTYTIAGVGSRARAAIADHLIMFATVLVLIIALAALNVYAKSVAQAIVGPWTTGATLIALVLGYWGYFVFFEAIWDGQTPGKRIAKLRVVREGGHSVTVAASAARNLLRIVDMQPGLLHVVAVGSSVFDQRGRRLGDLVAGTIVVQEVVGAVPVAAPRPARTGAPATPVAAALHAALSDDEFALLDGFVARQRDLPEARRTELLGQLGARFAPALANIAGATPMARLIALRDAERAARDRGLAAKNDTGAARERHAIVAQGSARWTAFATTLAGAQKRGLAPLGEPRVRDFVSDYRELAADLARLRTATRGQDAAEVFFLNRLVAGAHNLLYRRRTITLRAIARYVFGDVPAELRRSGGLVALAGFMMFFPMGIAWTSVVREPTVAATLVPAAMLDRAEDGVRRAIEETGYIPDPGLGRPVMAGGIIANNVRVAFAAFAAGITAGIGTVLLLISNGIQIGAVFGLYQSKGILPLILAFVAPHSVLELTAIAVAGAAGLLVAGVILVPGARSRRVAFREDAPRAVRLIAAATLFLFVAGLIEGLVSPIPYWPLQFKLIVAALTALALYAFVRLGATRGATAPPAP